MAPTTTSSRRHQRGLPIVSPLATMTSSTTPGAADTVASRPAVDQGLPQALADLTNAKKPLGGKRLRQRLHRLGRKIEDVVVTFKDIARDAQLESGAAATATATQKKELRPKNAERRRRQQQQQGQLGIDDNSYRGLPKEQREWVAVVVKKKKKNARQRHRTECPAFAAQGRTGERGRGRAQKERAAPAPEPTPDPDTADTDTAHTDTTDDPNPDPKPDATAPDPEIDRLKGQLAQARHIVTDLLVRAEKRTEAYDSRIAILEQTIVQYCTDTEKLRDDLRSATDKLTALTECTVAVQTDTGTQTELTPELAPKLTLELDPELTHRTEYTDPTDRCTQTTCTDVPMMADEQTQTQTLTLTQTQTQTHWDPDTELRQLHQQHEEAWTRVEAEVAKLREEKAAAETEVQRCYDFNEHIQTHHVTVNRQIAEAAATEIKRPEAALQEAIEEGEGRPAGEGAQGAQGGTAGKITQVTFR